MTDEGNESRKVAVITGASSGLGKTFAERLAGEGYDLLLVARRESLLEELKQEIEAASGVRVETRVVDLADEGQTKGLADELAARDDVEMLVNNAGFGTAGFLADVDIESQVAMIQVHVIAPMRLARAVLPRMIERRRGDIINVASVAGFLTGAGSVSYCATKTYLISASRSLAAEVRGQGVRVQALCPGFVYTGFHDTRQMEHFQRSRIPKFFWLTSEYVVDDSLRNLRRGKVVCIPSLLYKVLVAALTTPVLSSVLRWFGEKRVDRTEK